MTTQVPPGLEDRFARVADSQRQADADEDRREEPDAAGAKSGKESQATRLVDLGRRTPLFHDPEGNAYGSVSMGDHDETWRLRSGGFKSWLAKQYYEREGAIPRSGALQDALTTLEGVARFDGPELAVHLRHAHVDGVLYIDMGDPAWRVIEVSAAGWRVLDEAPVKFRRPRGMQALPEPVRGGSHGIESLRRFLNITDDDAWRLVVGFLLGCHSKGPYPVLILNGEQGSAKSTAGRVIRALVDPARTPDRSAPRDERDLIIAANNGHVVSFDNLSGLRDWQSDGLARLSTGAGFGTRELYSDAEETLFWAARPIILNGITDLAVRSDLLDRTLLVTLPRIADEDRRTAASFWSDFDAAAPAILGALLDAVSASLGGHRSVRLRRLPRMADFAVWVTAAEGALAWAEGDFMAAYGRNRASAHDLALDSASIVPPLHQLPATWVGSAGQLLEQLVSFAGERTTKRDDWPANPRALSGQLRRLAPDLRAVGIEVTFGQRTGQRRSIAIVRAERSGDGPSSASPPSPRGADDLIGDDGRDGDDGRGPARSAWGDLDPSLPANDDGWPEGGPAVDWGWFGEPPSRPAA